MMMKMTMMVVMIMMMIIVTVLLLGLGWCYDDVDDDDDGFTCGHKEVDFQLQNRGWNNPWNWNSGLANSIVIDMKSSSNSIYFDKHKEKQHVFVSFCICKENNMYFKQIKKTNVAACQTIPRSSWNYFSLHPGLLTRGSKEIHCSTAKKRTQIVLAGWHVQIMTS